MIVGNNSLLKKGAPAATLLGVIAALGNPLVIAGGISTAAMCGMDSSRVAFAWQIPSNRLWTYFFDGNNWATEGAQGNPGGSSLALGEGSATRVFLISGNLLILQACNFSGGTWSIVGSYNAGGGGLSALVGLTDTLVARWNTVDDYIQAITFTPPATFTPTGSTFPLVGGSTGAVAKMYGNSTDLVIYTETDANLRLIRWTGAGFTEIGNPMPIVGGGQRPALCGLKDNYFVSFFEDHQELQLWDHDGTDFIKVGVTPTAIVGTRPRLGRMSGSRIAAYADSTDALQCYTVT